ncbi:MAG: hypothetical protein E7168_01505 [Firmicutes bacterium]|nr:hypothetical protein [Bacillota bacterium]
MNGLFLTLLLGLFIILGALIVFLTKNNDKFIEFSISLATSVIFMLILMDIIPETIEVIETSNWYLKTFYILAGSSIGFFLLKALDHFIPDHDDDLETEEDDDKNLKHIGLVSSIALVIHNIVEGMAIYTLYTGDSTAGIMASIGVGLHNIPLGMIIASAFYKSNQNKLKTSLIIIGISLSTFLGGIIIYLFNIQAIMETIEAISLILTLGMLIYILIMELIPKVIHAKHKKITITGLISGILLLLLTLFI